MGWVGDAAKGFVGGVSDLVGIGDGRPRSAPQPTQPQGLYLPNAGADFGYRPMDHQSLYASQSNPAYKRIEHQSTMDAPFSTQWQSGPNGPQWVEPVRQSSNSWGSQVVTGPFKGNRI